MLALHLLPDNSPRTSLKMQLPLLVSDLLMPYSNIWNHVAIHAHLPHLEDISDNFAQVLSKLRILLCGYLITQEYSHENLDTI